MPNHYEVSGPVRFASGAMLYSVCRVIDGARTSAVRFEFLPSAVALARSLRKADAARDPACAHWPIQLPDGTIDASSSS
jgi:hypothetical protein